MSNRAQVRELAKEAIQSIEHPEDLREIAAYAEMLAERLRDEKRNATKEKP